MRIARVAAFVAGIWACGVEPASAQVGKFIDWIHKLSGPELITHALTFRFPQGGPGKYFGYNPGQVMTAGDSLAVLHLRQMMTDMRRDSVVAAAIPDSAEYCLRQAVDRSVGEAYHEASMDRIRVLGRLLHDDIVTVRSQRESGGGVDAVAAERIQENACVLRGALRDLQLDRGRGLRLRVDLLYGYDRGNLDRPEDLNVTALRPTVEYVVGLFDTYFFGFEGGVTYWNWHGPVEEFSSHSYSGVLSYFPFARDRSWWLRNLRVGIGVHGFASLDPKDFLPLVYPDVDEDGYEWVFGLRIGLDISRSAWSLAGR